MNSEIRHSPKKKYGKVKLYLLSGFLISLFFCSQIKIPCTQITRAFLKEHYNFLDSSLSLQMDYVSIDVFGNICIREVTLGSPILIRIPEIKLKISLIKFIFGKKQTNYI